MKDTDKIFDGLLVLQYQSGHKDAMNLLVKRHHYRLCQHSYWYTRDLDASKDIVQDCWSIIINKLHTLKDPNLFSSWATRIVTRKSLDHIKKEKKNNKHLQDITIKAEINDGIIDGSNKIKQLLKAIQLLPKNQQEVLQLFYTQEYSLKEISQILELSIGTVKSRLFHAREKLKIKIKDMNITY